MTVTRRGLSHPGAILSHPGAIPETIIPGIMALKPAASGGAWRPVPVRHGPLCAGCWDRTGRVKPAAYCGQHGYGHGLPLDGAP